MTTYTRSLFRLLVLGAAALGAGLVSAAPTFRNIKPLPLITERPAAAIDAETKIAFDAALAACRELARDSGKAAEASAAFEALVKAQTVENLRLQALEAYAMFLYNDRARAFDAQAVAVGALRHLDALAQLVLDRDRAQAAEAALHRVVGLVRQRVRQQGDGVLDRRLHHPVHSGSVLRFACCRPPAVRPPRPAPGAIRPTMPAAPAG